MMPQRRSVQIRSYQPADEKGIWDILQEGTYSNINSSFLICVKKTFSQVILISLIVAGYAMELSPLTLLIFFSIAVGLIYLFVIIGSLFYLHGSTLSDIKDIHRTYCINADHHFWVAEYDGQIAGTIAVVQKTSPLDGSPDIQPEDHDMDVNKKKVAWLRRMAVGKKFRRMGIAKMLVSECISFCRTREYDEIFLITTEVHYAARSLYSKLGFNLIGCKPKPYKYLKDLVTVLTYEFEMVLK